MANEEHLEILKQGVEVWNRWREKNPEIRPSFSGVDLHNSNFNKVNLSKAYLSTANFSGADLYEADLSMADLTRVNLCEANLTCASLQRSYLNGAYVSRANLSEANLEGAYLGEADFRRAILIGTNLNGAHLRNANFNEANLQKTDLRGADFNQVQLNEANLCEAKLGWTKFTDVDLSMVRALGTVQHQGPSYVDVHTLQRSKGKISEAFLRGTGISDTFITYVASLTNEAIQYYSCFISYSNQDKVFAQRLHADLQQNGVRCWFAPEDMKIGDKVRPRINESIRIHDKLLLILSENSLISFWVESEVEKAFEEERRRNQTVLFPVRLDEAVMETGQAWAADIRRTRYIGDFSRWKDHNAYQKAFERLLRDLKAEK